MRRLAAFIIAPALMLLASATEAPAERVDTCSAAHATAASIEELHADFDSWSGRCVTLRGIVFQGQLYADRNAILDQEIGEKMTRSIPLYREAHRRRPIKPGAAMAITGRLGNCADMHEYVRAEMEANSQVVVMVTGYCHYSSEEYLRPVSWRPTGGSNATRFTEAELPPQQRRLLEAPGDIAGRAHHVREARNFAAAFANRSEAEFRRLSDPELSAEIAAYEGRRLPDRLRDDVAEVRKAFRRETRRATFKGLPPLERRQERVFIDRVALPDIGRSVELITCWCRTTNCAGRWPTMAEDADNMPARPYSCVRTAAPPGQEATLTAEGGRRPPGLPEPRWPRR